MYRANWLRLSVAACLVALLAGSAGADVRLAAVFSDHMVLQRGCPVPVWGWAAPGQKVTVTVAGKKAEATADAGGRWKAELPALEAGGPHTLVVTGAGGNPVTVNDVLVGEVWLASGQSNMNMPIDWGVFGKWGSPECTEALAKIDDPELRMFLVGMKVSPKPAKDVSGVWKVAKGNEVLKWSAVGYFFGAELRRELGVPVGIVKSAVGGTVIESWMSREALLKVSPDLQASFDRWDRQVAEFDEAAHQKKVAEWEQEAAKAKAEGKRPPRRPTRVIDHNRMPASLYNGMIAPLVPYGLRGMLWYQGESNAGSAGTYAQRFPAMIRQWRKQWGQGDVPFLFVQLPNFRKPQTEPSQDADAWPWLREAQAAALRLPAIGMAVAIDIGDAADIHPKNKLDVGRRLALAAMQTAYGKDVVGCGPLYESMKVEGHGVRVRFAHTGGGLAARGGGPLKGFAVAGADHKFVWADAAIDGDSVVVRSAEVAEPVAVRYAWADNPVCNLVNAEGLPAAPFRTDPWPRAGGGN